MQLHEIERIYLDIESKFERCRAVGNVVVDPTGHSLALDLRLEAVAALTIGFVAIQPEAFEHPLMLSGIECRRFQHDSFAAHLSDFVSEQANLSDALRTHGQNTDAGVQVNRAERLQSA